jgi:hypothetical protein
VDRVDIQDIGTVGKSMGMAHGPEDSTSLVEEVWELGGVEALARFGSHRSHAK